MLQAQILTELTVNSSLTSDHVSSVPSTSLRIGDTLQPRTSNSPDSPTSPPLLVKGETLREKMVGLSRTHSTSDPQLAVATPTHRASTSSPIKAHSTNNTPAPSPRGKSPSQLSRGDQRSLHQSASDCSMGPSFGFLQSGPTSTALVRTSTTESLEQSSFEATTVSIEASPIKADQHQLKQVLSPDRPLTIPRMSPNNAGGNSNSVSQPQRKLAWTESTHQSYVTTPPSTIKTSPASQSVVTPTPQYSVTRPSPGYNSPYSVRLSPGNTNITMMTPTALGRSGIGSASLNESQSRATLMEKHRKHMEDLKLYYESELSQLRGRLEQLESERNDPSSINTRRSLSPVSPTFASTQRSPQLANTRQPRQLYFPSSLVKGRARTPASTGDGNTSCGDASSPTPPAMAAAVVNESELWMLQNENARLKGECSELRNQVDQSERDKRALEEQVKRMQEHTVRHMHAHMYVRVSRASLL